MIHPLPALVVRADTSILECIRVMKSKDVGSVLIISDDGKNELIGIFTERDLLKKVEAIAKGDYWSKPIRTVMTHPVKTLDIKKIDEAEKFLINNGFRHLPIVSIMEGSSEQLIGVISMRDLFHKKVIESQEGLIKPEFSKVPQKASLKTLVCTQDKGILDLIRQLKPNFSLTIIENTENPDKHQQPKTLDFLIFDLDGANSSEWAKSFQKIYQQSKPSHVLFFFNPILHTKKTQELLNKIKKSKKYHAFSKPVNILAVLEYFRNISS
jgi:CBS domain-containing protein